MHNRSLVILEVRNFVILVVCNRKSATAYFFRSEPQVRHESKKRKKHKKVDAANTSKKDNKLCIGCIFECTYTMFFLTSRAGS